MIPLSAAFGAPDLLEQVGEGEVLESLGESQYKNDEQFDNSLRSVLFQIPQPGQDPGPCQTPVINADCFLGVQDLGALDVERQRDHGIPFYNDLRSAYGLARKPSFTAITREATDRLPRRLDIDDRRILDFVDLRDDEGNPVEPGGEGAVSGTRRSTLASRLKAIYGDVNGNVDAFVGMVSEPHASGSELGELQLAIWRKQFAAAARRGSLLLPERSPRAQHHPRPAGHRLPAHAGAGHPGQRPGRPGRGRRVRGRGVEPIRRIWRGPADHRARGAIRNRAPRSYKPVMTDHDDDLQRVADRLRAGRPQLTALELDEISQRVRARSAARRRPRSAFMKSRLTILAMLVAGMLLCTTGAGLAVSGLSSKGNAASAAYPNEQPQGDVLGEEESGGGGGRPAAAARRGGTARAPGRGRRRQRAAVHRLCRASGPARRRSAARRRPRAPRPHSRRPELTQSAATSAAARGGGGGPCTPPSRSASEG